MTVLRMDNVGVVFDDLDGQRVDIAMMRTPDGHSKLELMSYQTPAMISPGPKDAPPNTLGIRRLMFAVDDIEDTVVRTQLSYPS